MRLTGDIVHERGLAKRVLVLGGGVAPVVAALGTTNESTLRPVHLLGSVGRVWEAERDERGGWESGNTAVLCVGDSGEDES